MEVDARRLYLQITVSRETHDKLVPIECQRDQGWAR